MTTDSAPRRWDAASYDTGHSYVWRHGAGLVELLAPQPGERILDLGCGTGHLTGQIAAAGAEVVGADLSAAMVEQARANYPELRFEVADATNFHLGEPFDAVFSNAVLHWVRPPERAVACVRAALKPGGRFVAEFGGKGNVQGIVRALTAALEAFGYPEHARRNPWYFPSVGEYSALLEQHGLEVTFGTLFDRPTPLDGGEQGIRNWLEMFAPHFLAEIPSGGREEIIRSVEEQLRPTLWREGEWSADYRRLRVVAVAEG